MTKNELELEFNSEVLASDVDFDVIAKCINNDHIATSTKTIHSNAKQYSNGNEIKMIDVVRAMINGGFANMNNLTIPHEAGHIIVMEHFKPGSTILGTKLGYSGFENQSGIEGLHGAMGGYAGEMVANKKASNGACMDMQFVKQYYNGSIDDLVNKDIDIIKNNMEAFNKVCELLKNNDYITKNDMKGIVIE